MNEFIFTIMRCVFVRFLEEIENAKKAFWNYLTFSMKDLNKTKMQRNENTTSEKMSSHSGIFFYKFYAVGDVDSALILSKGELLECSGGEGLELFVVGII